MCNLNWQHGPEHMCYLNWQDQVERKHIMAGANVSCFAQLTIVYPFFTKEEGVSLSVNQDRANTTCHSKVDISDKASKDAGN